MLYLSQVLSMPVWQTPRPAQGLPEAAQTSRITGMIMGRLADFFWM